jgi:hypothetical protein
MTLFSKNLKRLIELHLLIVPSHCFKIIGLFKLRVSLLLECLTLVFSDFKSSLSILPDHFDLSICKFSLLDVICLGLFNQDSLLLLGPDLS